MLKCIEREEKTWIAWLSAVVQCFCQLAMWWWIIDWLKCWVSRLCSRSVILDPYLSYDKLKWFQKIIFVLVLLHNSFCEIFLSQTRCLAAHQVGTTALVEPFSRDIRADTETLLEVDRNLFFASPTRRNNPKDSDSTARGGRTKKWSINNPKAIINLKVPAQLSANFLPSHNGKAPGKPKKPEKSFPSKDQHDWLFLPWCPLSGL